MMVTQNKMSIKKMNFGNLKDSAVKPCKRIWVSFAEDPSKCQFKKKLKWFVFEQEKDPVVQWLSCI